MNIFKSMQSVITLSALSAILVFSSVSSANPANNGAEFGPVKFHKQSKHMMKRMIKKLSLTDQQQTQIKEIKTQAKTNNETMRDSMKQFRKAVKSLQQAQQFDEQAFAKLHAQYQPTMAKIALSKAKTKHAIFNVLTKEQQTKWLKILEKRNKKGRRG